MVERKHEPPWGGIKQLNFPLVSASPTTTLNGKGHRTLQQNISQTRCTTALGHDMLPGPRKGLTSFDLTGAESGSAGGSLRPKRDREEVQRQREEASQFTPK